MNLTDRASIGSFALVFSFLGAACRVGPEYVAPERPTGAAWSETSDVASAAEPVEAWWSTFQDATLDGLVRRALAQNLDLALARARVLEARALRDVATGGDKIQVDAQAGYTRSRRSDNEVTAFGPRERDLYAAGFDARWELDFFGRVDRDVQAAQAGVESAIEARRDAALTLLGDVARNYVELRGAQRELAVARGNLALQRETLELMRGRFQAGLSNDLDVARAQGLVATTEAELPTLETAARTRIHRLSVMLALDPGALRDEIAPEGAVSADAVVPVGPDVVAAGLPADLLRRRPDVRRAERDLARECALTGVARLALYPTISLAASWGQRTSKSSNLFDSASNAWSIGPSFVMPIFEAGVLKANVRAQEARQQQALVRWEQSVLQAQAEVEDALVSLARERERNASLVGALDAQRRAVSLANDLFTRGLVDYFQVLDAQRDLFTAEGSLARSTTALASNTVALYKALGGGWTVADEAEPRDAALAALGRDD